MAVRRDPEGRETECLHRLVRFENTRVVELGCGDGRVTRRYADRAAEVIALDPDEARIATAWATTTLEPPGKVEFRVGDARFTGLPAGWADIVLFSRSL